MEIRDDLFERKEIRELIRNLNDEFDRRMIFRRELLEKLGDIAGYLKLIYEKMDEEKNEVL